MNVRVNPWESIISEERVQQLYAAGMHRYGHVPARPRPDCLQQCLGNAWTAEQYLQEEQGVSAGLVFAVRLMCYLVGDHCYTDGNKRVAWASMTYVLRHHGLDIQATDDEAQTFVETLLRHDITQDDALTWVASRLAEAT